MKQTVSFTISIEDDGNTGVSVDFDPALVTSKEKLSKLSAEEQELQNGASHIASLIMENLRKLAA